MWVNYIQHPDLTPMAYADNLSWSSASFEAHEQTLARTIHFFQLLQIPIDWEKTWVWSMSSSDQQQWHRISQQILPEGCALSISHEAMGLGVSMNYSSHNRLNNFQDKFQLVTKRLEKLFRENYSLPLTSKLIQSAVWTKKNYGPEVGLHRQTSFPNVKGHGSKGTHTQISARDSSTSRCLG